MPREPIDKPPAVDAPDAAPAALGYQAMEAVVLPPLQRNERSPLTLEKLLNAAHWAARRGNDPGNMRHLRQEINPYFTNAEIERALKEYCGGPAYRRVRPFQYMGTGLVSQEWLKLRFSQNMFYRTIRLCVKYLHATFWGMP